MKISKLVKMSLLSVFSNKIRSFLTMLGIIIGISSVIIIVGMGEGSKQQISSQIEKLGTNLITISITGKRTNALTNDEINALKLKPGIKDIAPAISQSVSVKSGDKTYSTTLEASTPNYEEIRKLSVSAGRFIKQLDLDNRFNVAVIGQDVATELYGSTNVVGNTIKVDGVNFSVIGVLSYQGSSTTGSGDDRIIVPLTTAQRLLKTTTVKSFYAEAKSKDEVDTTMGYLTLFMNKKYKNDTSAYRVFNQTSILETANQTSDTMTLLLSGVAAISLLVGGIGIMNIMLVSVIERTKEIGIRKAIGAKRRVILSQFLIEAAFISGLGGIIGVAIGHLGAFLIKTYAKTPVVISTNVVVSAFAFSVFVGIVFGMYPANKASKLNPIEALRFE